ncbi:MFS transporter [Microvirga sp. TS319]|uniref:MFS transporter n=1 Tax=Microvirga sp. TS319 TaxID=3241165 RepID=UPI00351A0620
MDEVRDGRPPAALFPNALVLMLTLCLGEGIYALNSFLVSTSLPSAVIELGGAALIGWAFTVYLVAAIVGGASAGFLKARLGARRLLIWPAIVFLAGTLLASEASSMITVLVGRTLQGLGEGIIAAACYVLVAEFLPPRLVPRFFGLIAVTWAGCAFGGPLLAGFVTETWSWRAAFLMNVPLILIFMGLVLAIIPPGRGGAAKGMPPLGRLAAIAAGIMLIAVAGLQSQWWLTAGLVGLAIAMLAGIVLLDKRSRYRLFPSDAFSLASTVGAGLWVALLMPVAQASTSVYLPLSLQRLWDYSPTEAGFVSALMALSWSAAAFAVSFVSRAPWPRRLVRSGPLLLVLGLAGAALALLSELPWVLIGAQIAIGCGFGISWAFLSQAIMTSARPGEQDLASGLVPTTQSAGYAIGAATAGIIAQAAGFDGDLAPEILAPAMVAVFSASAVMAVGAWLVSLRVAATSTEGTA